MPVGGVITAGNEALEDEPALVNTSPMQDGTPVSVVTLSVNGLI